jgi:hypothetical protein
LCRAMARCSLALKKLTGVKIEKMLPTSNINLGRVPVCPRYLGEGKHRRLYRFSREDYAESAGVWSNDEVTLPGDPPGKLEAVVAVCVEMNPRAPLFRASGIVLICCASSSSRRTMSGMPS